MMVEFFRASTPLRLQASGPLGLGEGTGARTPAVLRFVTWGLPCGAQPQRRFFSKATGRLLLVYFATCIVMESGDGMSHTIPILCVSFCNHPSCARRNASGSTRHASLKYTIFDPGVRTAASNVRIH